MANLRVAELDFDTIKSNLKTFLSSQSEFTDYDFEGSGLSTLIDLLAYNTHYNAYLANMLMNELFLDSAVKRTSAVSIAKHLGYVPRSVRGARATVTVQVNSPAGSPTSLTLSRYTPFTTTINGTTLTFLNTSPYSIAPTGSSYIFNDVEIIEGQNFEYRYTVSSPGPNEKFEIPSADVDTTTLRVIVQNSSADTTQTVYSLFSDLSTVESNSNIYYLEENGNGRYQVFFGDGIFGKLLSAGNIVILQYLICSGENGNVSGNLSQSFTLNGTVEGNSNLTITTNNNSTGGANKETISEIKFNAPRQYLTQNRAITAEDYKSIITTNYPLAQSIAVWGGEDNVPPIYGKIIISLKPYDGYVISNTTKEFIRNSILGNRKAMAIQIEFVDPEYFYVNLSVTVKYNSRNTTASPATIRNLVITSINNYFRNNLERFDADFFLSKLSANIDSVNSSIVGTLIQVSLQKRIEPTLRINNAFSGTDSLNFYNKIKPNGVTSTRFSIVSGTENISVVFKDVPDTIPPNPDGTGTLVLRNILTGQTVVQNVGTINYATGVVSINSFTPIGYPIGQNDLRINAELQEDYYDITASRQQIVVLDDSTLDPLADRIAGLNVNVIDVAL